MSGKKIRRKSNVKASYQQAIHAALQHLTEDTLVLDGKPVSKDALVGFLQQYVDAAQASTDAHTAWIQAVAKERHTIKVVSAPHHAALQHYIAARFGTNSDEYLAFGFAPPKPRVKSPEAKVVGAAKMRATRKARHTMGRKQRLAITGAVPSAITLPVDAPTEA
jgi:hypothetical protein